MKKIFLTPLAALVAAVTADANAALHIEQTSLVAPHTDSDQIHLLDQMPKSASEPFVLKRSEVTGQPLAVHYSHSSHASHASHSSHFSSR